MLYETWIQRSNFVERLLSLASPSRRMRSLGVISLALLLAACGAEAAPHVDGGGGAGGSGGGAGGTAGVGVGGDAGHGGSGGQVAGPDPLDLGSCDAPIGTLSSAVALPALGWDDGGDDHAAHCAFRALDPLLEGKRILCSGENDHGVAQSYRWHAALARYLVHTWNVRVIALEMDTASVAHWNRYLTSGSSADLERGFAGGKGSLADARDIEWFVESLRAVQAELPAGERIELTGYDVAVQPAPTIAALADFLEQVDPASVDGWTSGWRTNDYAAAAAHAELFLAELEVQRDAWIAATDKATWNAAVTNAANLFDGFRFIVEYAAGNFPAGNTKYREPGMIRNVEAFAAALGEDERLVLVGHNLHCARAMPASGAYTIAESPALGTHLARSETWGSQYLVLAQLYLRGTHNVLGSLGIVEQAFDSGSSSLAGLLGTLSEEPALLIGTDAEAPRMDVTQDLRVFGTHNFPLVPEEQFDGFLWVREVERTELR